jgi:hypothetical protein
VKETKHEITKISIEREKSKGEAIKRFNHRFRFENPEPLRHEFACKFASGARTLMIGSAFITQRYLCFAGANGTGAISITLPLKRITGIETGSAGFKDNYKKAPNITPTKQAPGVPPNAILVYDGEKFVHRFYSISDIKHAVKELNGAWGEAKEAKSEAKPVTPSDSTPAEKTPPTERTTPPSSAESSFTSPRHTITVKALPMPPAKPKDKDNSAQLSPVAAPTTPTTPTATAAVTVTPIEAPSIATTSPSVEDSGEAAKLDSSTSSSDSSTHALTPQAVPRPALKTSNPPTVAATVTPVVVAPAVDSQAASLAGVVSPRPHKPLPQRPDKDKDKDKSAQGGGDNS